MLAGASLLLLASAPVFAQTPAANNPASRITPVTDEMLRKPADGDWLMWRRTYDGYGYSPLDQINKDNVKNLKPAWSWSMNPAAPPDDADRPRRRAVPQEYDDKIQALNAATGDLIWEYSASFRPSCCHSPIS